MGVQHTGEVEGTRRRRGWTVAVGAVALALVTAAALSVLPREDPVLQATLTSPADSDSEPAEVDPESVEPYHEGIEVRARETEVTPAEPVGAESAGDVTGVWVEVDNDSDHPLVVQAGAFILSDTHGRTYEPAPGVDVRELGDGAMIRVEQGGGVSGVVTARGDFTPATVDFYPDNSGIPVTAEVDARDTTRA